MNNMGEIEPSNTSANKEGSGSASGNPSGDIGMMIGKACNPLASNSNAKLRLSSFVSIVPRTFRGAANANSLLFLMPKLPLGRRPPFFFFLRTPELFFFFLGPFSIFIGGLSRVVEELDDEELDREELDDVCNTGLLNN